MNCSCPHRYGWFVCEALLACCAASKRPRCWPTGLWLYYNYTRRYRARTKPTLRTSLCAHNGRATVIVCMLTRAARTHERCLAGAPSSTPLRQAHTKHTPQTHTHTAHSTTQGHPAQHNTTNARTRNTHHNAHPTPTPHTHIKAYGADASDSLARPLPTVFGPGRDATRTEQWPGQMTTVDPTYYYAQGCVVALFLLPAALLAFQLRRESLLVQADRAETTRSRATKRTVRAIVGSSGYLAHRLELLHLLDWSLRLVDPWSMLGGCTTQLRQTF